MPILKKFGKKRDAIARNKVCLSVGKENWPCNGQKERYRHIFAALNGAHVRFLVRHGNPNPNVMVLGAGKGETILEFKNFLLRHKVNPTVDVFSLTKNLDPYIKKIVHKDFSENIPFEHLNVKDSAYKNLKNKYDLVIGAMSVGVHTKYPVNSLFTSALMLQKGGRAYIEMVDFLKGSGKSSIKELKEYFKKKDISFIDDKILYQKQFLVLENVFLRMVKVYNPKLKFSIKILDDYEKHFAYRTNFIEIRRVE